MYGFLVGVFAMNGVEDGINTTGDCYKSSFSVNNFRQYFALKYGIDTVDAVFCIYRFHTVLVIMNNVDSGMNVTDVYCLKRFTSVTVCYGYE